MTGKQADPRRSDGADAASERLSRRAVLGAASGAAAGVVASALLHPRRADATTGDAVKAGNVTLAEGPTEVRYDGSTTSGIVLLANDSTHTTAGTAWFYPAAVAGFAGASTGGSAGHGIQHGVHGFTETGNGFGVIGYNSAADILTGGAGVYGYCANTNGAGVYAQHGNNGLALKVGGKASFATSGRAAIPKNQAFVDVFVASGFSAESNVLAMLQSSRAGVWVRACRKNYPSLDYVRIYLNKVASTTSSTPVAWFVFDAPA